MKTIRKVFSFAYYASFDERKLSYVAIYRRGRAGDWLFSLAKSEDHRVLLDEFDSLKSYRTVQSGKKWVGSWTEAIMLADRYDWHLGYPTYIVTDYVDRVWAAFVGLHSEIEEVWRLELEIDRGNIEVKYLGGAFCRIVELPGR